MIFNQNTNIINKINFHKNLKKLSNLNKINYKFNNTSKLKISQKMKNKLQFLKLINYNSQNTIKSLKIAQIFLNETLKILYKIKKISLNKKKYIKIKNFSSKKIDNALNYIKNKKNYIKIINQKKLNSSSLEKKNNIAIENLIAVKSRIKNIYKTKKMIQYFKNKITSKTISNTPILEKRINSLIIKNDIQK